MLLRLFSHGKTYRVFFLTGTPLKSSKYTNVNLGKVRGVPVKKNTLYNIVDMYSFCPYSRAATKVSSLSRYSSNLLPIDEPQSQCQVAQEASHVGRASQTALSSLHLPSSMKFLAPTTCHKQARLTVFQN